MDEEHEPHLRVLPGPIVLRMQSIEETANAPRHQTNRTREAFCKNCYSSLKTHLKYHTFSKHPLKPLAFFYCAD